VQLATLGLSDDNGNGREANHQLPAIPLLDTFRQPHI
jgi:hypothetical protein